MALYIVLAFFYHYPTSFEPDASVLRGFSSESASGSVGSASRRLWPLTRLSVVCLRGLRVLTVIVSRVTREVRSVFRSIVELAVVCLRDEVEGFRSVAEELERGCECADMF